MSLYLISETNSFWWEPHEIQFSKSKIRERKIKWKLIIHFLSDIIQKCHRKYFKHSNSGNYEGSCNFNVDCNCNYLLQWKVEQRLSTSSPSLLGYDLYSYNCEPSQASLAVCHPCTNVPIYSFPAGVEPRHCVLEAGWSKTENSQHFLVTGRFVGSESMEKEIPTQLMYEL